MSDKNDTSENKGFWFFASFKFIIGFIVVMGCLWLGSMVFSFFSGSSDHKSKYNEMVEKHPNMQKADGIFKGMMKKGSESEKKTTGNENVEVKNYEGGLVDNEIAANRHSEGHSEATGQTSESHKTEASKPEPPKNAAPSHGENKSDGHGEKKEGSGHGEQHKTYAFKGEAFIDALIENINREVNDRYWGWRPNDIFRFGLDNVMHYQFGVHEMTRQTANILANRIARIGTDEAMNKYLNNAWTCFSIDPRSYWFPSAESEYNQAISDLKKYKAQLQSGESRFYTRPDNLIPLLQEFVYRLGDCEDRLVDKKIGFFEADDRFYYVKGAATVMHSVLEAVAYDFNDILQTRYGMDTLKRAIEECHEASIMAPWFIIDADYDGFFANHRANMAAYIGHARFYLSVLITTLTT